MTEVLVLRTGVANLASVEAALARAGATVRFGREAAEVADAARLVLPGVGAFAHGMAALDPVAAALQDRIAQGRPTLAICLGLQLLAEGSEESPGVAGLGVLPGVVARLGSEGASQGSAQATTVAASRDLCTSRAAPGTSPVANSVRVPHFGWSRVEPEAAGGLVEPGHAYFAHSFCLRYSPGATPKGWTISTTMHGAPFVAAIERGSVLACQFHPELSGAWGAALIERWLAQPW
jgi:imidazoleglycerol phosphate synthase glutamine amidotransferase subunit HisH